MFARPSTAGKRLSADSSLREFQAGACCNIDTRCFIVHFSEGASIETPETHNSNLQKSNSPAFHFSAYEQSLPVLFPSQSTTPPIKAQSVCSVQHFSLFNTGQEEWRGRGGGTHKKKGLNLLQLVEAIWFCLFYLPAAETICRI